MTPADWERVKAVFNAALEVEPPKRSEVIARLAADSELVRAEVERLLDSDELASGFLEKPVPLDALGPELAPVFSPGRLLAERFRVTRLIGAGGMGEVYEALDLLTANSRVALKTISADFDRHPRSRDLFRSELLAARKVTHPGICRVHELYEENGLMFLTMEMLDGLDLASVVRKSGPMPAPEAGRILHQLAEAVSAAHQAGILHCDLKPSNVILTCGPDGTNRPVITDFGLARSAAAATGGNFRAGTPIYMAPELSCGAVPSFASDVYSLGVIAREVLTGIRAMDRSSTLTGRTPPSRPTPPPTRMPRGWRKIVERCLSIDPAKRYSSAAELASAIARLETRRSRITRRALLLPLALGPVAAYYAYRRAGERIGLSLAILPFEDRTPDRELRYLADGFAGELIRTLGRVPGLHVTAPQSSSRFRDTKANIAQIAGQLHVEAIVRGTIERRNGLLEAQVDVIRARTGRTVWSRRFRRSPGEAMEMRREMALSLAGFLPLTLAPSEAAILRAPPTVEPQAYNKYLLGLQQANTRTPDGLSRSIELFSQATEIDSHFALAYAALAMSAAVLAGRSGSPVRPFLDEAEIAATAALRWDDSLPEAHLAYGAVRQRKYWDWKGAESHFREAARLGPGLATAHHWLAGLLSNLGQAPEALAEIQIAQSLDPLSLPVNTAYGGILVRARRPDEAIQQLELTNSLGPSYRYASPLLGEAWAMKGLWEHAAGAFRLAAEQNPQDEFARAGLAYALAKGGRPKEARAIQAVLAKAKASPVSLSLVHIGLEELEEAVESLEFAFEQRDPTLVSVAAEPYNDPLRRFPRFIALLRKMALA